MRRRTILVGGSSSVGKTTAARALATRHGWELVQTDGALPSDPILQPLVGPDEILDRPVAELCALLIAAADAAILPLRSLIAGRPASAGLIVEGERIHPQLVAQLEHEGSARGVLVVETDSQRLYDTLVARSPGFRRLPESRQRCVAEMDRLYGQWLLEQGVRLRVQCVSSQPWTSLPDRILESVHISAVAADAADELRSRPPFGADSDHALRRHADSLGRAARGVSIDRGARGHEPGRRGGRE